MALPSDRPFTRWAAQSAGISLTGDAPDLLGVGLEERAVQAPAEPGDEPALVVRLVLRRPDPGPRVGADAADRFDGPEVLQDVRRP